jgi:hypothetical protein
MQARRSSGTYGAGGAGGGAVRLVANSLTLDEGGKVTADGETPSSTLGGGGASGAIWFDALSMTKD